MATSNPASAPAVKGERKRLPMSVPTRRLEVPEIPGFHTHWFLESRVPRAQQAGYEFVDFNEVPVPQRGIGTDTEISGNMDLGSRIRQVGGVGEDGKPEHLVLMKLREEWWNEDKARMDESNAARLAGIFREESILDKSPQSSEDRNLRYIDRSRTKALFQRPARK